jgi:EAL domain-containing protein (putative c-di-GMP-specific phosphodiesterase class I)
MKILVVDDDRIIAEGIAQTLAGAGYAVIVTQDAASAEVIVDAEPIAAVVSDIRLTGPFRFEGLEFIDYVRARSSGCRIVIMSGIVTPEIRVEALRRGATGVLEKPFEMAELERLLPQPDAAAGTGTIVHVPSLTEILEHPARIVSHFQPIVRLNNPGTEVFAFEALCRLDTASPLARPDLLFDYAARLKRVVDLELTTVVRSLVEGTSLAAHGLVFLNLHPAALLEGNRLAARIFETAATVRFPLDRLVLELTEQQAIRVDAETSRTFAMLRERGVRFAFDDVGSAYSHLSLMDVVRPEFLKVSQHFGTDFERDPTRTKLVRNLLLLANDFQSELILEGIESAATADAARREGITLGQGYHFARPALPEAFVDWIPLD